MGQLRRSPDLAMVRYVDARRGEHYIALGSAGQVPFEDCRMARNIPAYENAAHTPGRYWSATTGQLVEYESHLEEIWMTLLDFDTEVIAFAGQPMELEAVDQFGVWRHIPDIFVRRADGSALLVDVKSPHVVDEPSVRLQAERTGALCGRLGWGYALVTTPPAQQWANVSELAGHRRPLHLGEEMIPRLLDLARTPMPLGDLLSFMTFPDLARGVLLHLCWRQQVVFDLEAPLRESTLMRTNPLTLGASGEDTGAEEL